MRRSFETGWGTVMRVSLPRLIVIFCCLTCLTAEALGQVDSSYVPVKEPLSVFKMIAEQSRSNFERIKTWQGVYEFEEKYVPSDSMVQEIRKSIESPLPAEFVILNAGAFEFYIDMRKDCLFVDYIQTSVSIEGVSGEQIEISTDLAQELNDKFLSHFTSVITPKEFLSFDKTAMLGSYPDLGDVEDRTGRVAFRYASKKSPLKSISIFVDPRDFMKFGSAHFWEFCSNVANKKRRLFVKTESNESRVYLNESVLGGKVKYQVYIDYVGKDDSVFEYIVDGDVAFNVCMYANGPGFVNKGYNPREKVLCEYVEIDGVFVPSLVERHLGETSHEGLYKFMRRSKLLRCEINKPLPEGVFTQSALGLKDGDRLNDVVRNKLFEVVDGKVVQISTSLGNHRVKMTVFRYVLYVLIVLGVVFIFFGIWIRLQKRWRIAQ
jgi:hypothetical protein